MNALRRRGQHGSMQVHLCMVCLMARCVNGRATVPVGEASCSTAVRVVKGLVQRSISEVTPAAAAVIDLIRSGTVLLALVLKASMSVYVHPITVSNGSGQTSVHHDGHVALPT